MTRLHRWVLAAWAWLDWRRAAEVEWRHRHPSMRGAEAMLGNGLVRVVHDEETGRDAVTPYRLGDSDGTRLPEPSDGEAVPPRTIIVPRDTLMSRVAEARDGGGDYPPPWRGEGL